MERFDWQSVTDIDKYIKRESVECHRPTGNTTEITDNGFAASVSVLRNLRERRFKFMGTRNVTNLGTNLSGLTKTHMFPGPPSPAKHHAKFPRQFFLLVLTCDDSNQVVLHLYHS